MADEKAQECGYPYSVVETFVNEFGDESDGFTVMGADDATDYIRVNDAVVQYTSGPYLGDE